MSPRVPSVCNHPGCTEDATAGGRCAAHQRKAWQNRSPSSLALAGNAAHRQERAAAVNRTGNRCECCGASGTVVRLALHHPHPIAAGGSIVQADSVLLCPDCHGLEQVEADARHARR